MIRYSLVCDNAHDFEGWFRDSADFSRQSDRDLLACPVCGSHGVSKKLMAPAVVGSRATAPMEEDVASTKAAAQVAAQSVEAAAQNHTQASAMLAALSPDQTKMVELARRLRREVEKNADYVGRRFAEEARKIHYGDAEARGIYGETTPEDAAALIEEGVEVLPLPLLPEEQN